MQTAETKPQPRLAVLALVVLVSAAGVSAQDCDCSCEGYAGMMAAVEEFRKQQDAGTSPGIPPEMMQMSQCAGQCAMAWAQCANPDLDVEAMQRGMQGAEDGSATRRGTSPAEPPGESESGLPKSRLSGDYLEGTWCSVYGGQETTQWVFTDAGDYRLGVPAGNGYALQPEVRDLEHFKRRFERLVEHQSETFTTMHVHGRKNVFTRGPCD